MPKSKKKNQQAENLPQQTEVLPKEGQKKFGLAFKGSLVTHNSPYPPPEVIREFEAVAPGTAKRLLDMAENNVIFLQNKDSEFMKNCFSMFKRGQICALIVAVSGIIGACVCAYLNQPVPASVIGGGALVTITLAFLNSNSR